MTTLRVEGPFDGPVHESSIRVAGRVIRLIRPIEPDRLLDDPAVIARNVEEDYMPYWAYLWPGSLLLGEAVAALDWPSGTKAVEIGCGLGLPGLVALSLGLHVRFTDYDPTPLRFVEASARANGFDPSSYSTALIDWRAPPPERFPLILGADVTYERRLVPLVAGVIAALLEPGGLALITDPNRSAAGGFADELRAHGLATEAVPLEGTFDGLGLVRGTLHRVWHPASRLKADSSGGSR